MPMIAKGGEELYLLPGMKSAARTMGTPSAADVRGVLGVAVGPVFEAIGISRL
jgi:hypothetical protein